MIGGVAESTAGVVHAPASVARLRSVDLLRGCAALAVIAAHAFNHGRFEDIGAPWFVTLHSVVRQGVLGVPLFFVISGFCIHLPWARQMASQGAAHIDFGAFWKRRLHRLYPPYFVALCGSLAAVLIAWSAGLAITTVTRYPEPRAQWIGLDFVLHATMLHGLSPAFDLAAGNPPFWTLAREEYLYLMYFLVLFWRRRYGLGRALALVWGIGVALPWTAKLAIPLVTANDLWQSRFWYPVNFETSAIALWIQWCLGMAAVESYYGLIRLPAWCGARLLVPVWAAVAGLSQYAQWTIATPVLWGMTFFTLLNCVVALEKSCRWPSSRALVWLRGAGVASYSLYLVHSPIIGLLNQIELRAVGRPSPLLLLPAAHVAVWMAFMAVAILAGGGFFVAVESRYLNSHLARTVAE